MSWKDFLAAHMSLLAGADFFTVEVLKWRGLETRMIMIARRNHPASGRRVDGADRAERDSESWGYLSRCRYVLHDRDGKFYASFRSVLTAGGVKPIMLPAKSPNLNAYAERWARSVKQECLPRLILFGEGPLQRSRTEYAAHYHLERNHQGKGQQAVDRRLSRRA